MVTSRTSRRSKAERTRADASVIILRDSNVVLVRRAEGPASQHRPLRERHVPRRQEDIVLCARLQVREVLGHRDELRKGRLVGGGEPLLLHLADDGVRQAERGQDVARHGELVAHLLRAEEQQLQQLLRQAGPQLDRREQQRARLVVLAGAVGLQRVEAL